MAWAALLLASGPGVGTAVLFLGILGIPLFAWASGRDVLSRRRPHPDTVGALGGMSEIVSLQEASERRRRELAQAALAELGDALTSSLEPQSLFERCAEALARDLCDVCVINVVQEGGASLRHAAVALRDASHAPVGASLRGRDFTPRRPFLGEEALKARAPVLCSEVTPAGPLSACASPAHASAFEALGVRSWISLPLIVDSEVLGTVWLLRSKMGCFVEEDLKVADEVGLRMTHALENAKRYLTAQSATAARDRLLSVVAHDLRNPLHAILLRTQTLAKQEGVQETPGLVDSLEAILRSARQMNRLIADLLCAEQLENGSLKLQRQNVHPAALAEQALAELAPLTATHRVELDVEPGLGMVSADPTRILQVFSNLLGNAIKFTPPHALIHVSIRGADEEIRFEVADAGPGLPGNHGAFLFEPFQQGRKDGRGIGLGMWICRQIVESHGGRIWVARSGRSGTTLCFTVPIAPSASLALLAS